MDAFTIKDRVAIAGIGETTDYRRGAAPASEFRLTLEVILRAAAGYALVQWQRVAKAD